jgi:ankyrin repeat protein
VKRQLAAKCDVNAVDSENRTPLMWAIDRGHEEIFKVRITKYIFIPISLRLCDFFFHPVAVAVAEQRRRSVVARRRRPDGAALRRHLQSRVDDQRINAQ